MYEDPETGDLYSTRHVYEARQIQLAIQRGDLRPIEGFSKYTITEDGVVVNIGRARPVKPFSNGHRLAITLQRDGGGKTSLGLGRLIANHFIPQPDDEQYYDVVFKDGDVTNVHPSNLDWQPHWKRHADPANYDIDLE